MVDVNLVVLRTNNLECLKGFYESLGLVFEGEQHGSGPFHYSSLAGSVVLELYPAKEPVVDSSMIGFRVNDVDGLVEKLGDSSVQKGGFTDTGQFVIVTDPDGRKVYLTE
jgi:lactoylglutathione lyase